MNRARENSLWHWLEKGATSPDLVLKRVENLVDTGFPDTIGCWGGLTIAIELKVGIPRADGTIWCRLTGVQSMTLIQFAKAKASAWVLAQVGVGAAAQRFLIPAADSPKIIEPVPLSLLRSLTRVDPKATPTQILSRVMALW